MIISDVAIGVSANVEPTERSNSPQIIRIVTPIETSPTSGSRPRMPRKLSADRNAPSERSSKTTVRMTQQRDPGQLRLFQIDPEEVSQRGASRARFGRRAGGAPEATAGVSAFRVRRGRQRRPCFASAIS